MPYLARHFRVVTVDPRGNGRSDRPLDAAAYDDSTYVADTIAVLDELGIERAVLVGICYSAWQALLCRGPAPRPRRGRRRDRAVATDHTPPLEPRRGRELFDEKLDELRGLARRQPHYWLEDWPDFVEFFFGSCCVEPHSSKVRRGLRVAFACETTGELMVAEPRAELLVATPEEAEELLPQHRVPGAGHPRHRRPVPAGGRFDTVVAAGPARERLVLEGSGHLPLAPRPGGGEPGDQGVRRPGLRHPDPRAALDARTCPTPRVLYLSSPIGLGHVRRDLAIADALREERPDVEVAVARPVTGDRLPREAGENVHPASAYLASESGHFEAESGEHDLHAFQAIRRMDEILVNNFMVFDDLVERETSTSGSATRRGTSTTSCTRTPN